MADGKSLWHRLADVLTIYPFDELLESVDFGLDARLCECVVVLDTVQQFRGTPETVCFYQVQGFL